MRITIWQPAGRHQKTSAVISISSCSSELCDKQTFSQSSQTNPRWGFKISGKKKSKNQKNQKQRQLHIDSRGTITIYPKTLWDVGPHAAFIKDHTRTTAWQTSTSPKRQGPTRINVGARKRQKEKRARAYLGCCKIKCDFQGFYESCQMPNT